MDLYKLYYNLSIGEFPSIVSLQYLDKHKCGGTIISKTHVLTAAHCFREEWLVPEDWLVITGSIFPEKSNTYHLKEIKLHPKYMPRPSLNDIAILVIKEEFKLGNNLKVMGMANDNDFHAPKGTYFSQKDLDMWEIEATV